MKRRKIIIILLLISCSSTLTAYYFSKEAPQAVTEGTDSNTVKKACVFKTVFGEEPFDSTFLYNPPEKVNQSIQKALKWMVKAQHSNGGWGAGSHYSQNIIDPHAVKTDPATTAMVGMAIMRTGTTLTQGDYSEPLNKALLYLIRAVENAPENSNTITKEENTQIQTKLGANIDVIITAQFFTNVMDYLEHDKILKEKVDKCLNICVVKIQRTQDKDGSFTGSGWAGVLQSSFATNALESALAKGAKVDTVILEKSKDYQKGNYDSKSGNVKTDKGAGIVLYSVSGSTRASAKDARKVEEEVKKAKQDGKIASNANVDAATLQNIGYSKDDALKYSTSYNVYQAGKNKAQQSEVMDGFGNNGGEEFLSYLQTGESMIIGKDNEWKKWYDNVSGRLMSVQNNDGSWNGHHCITSPVFCTATCLLILSANNDVERLVSMGGK